MRSSETLTAQEIDSMVKFCSDNQVFAEGEIGSQNANRLVDYLLNTWNVDVNEQTLTAALDRLRNQIRFYTPLEFEYKTLAARMTEAQRDLILNFITRRGLKDDGENQLVNFNTIASWMSEKNTPIATSTLDAALGNIMNHSRRPLLWKQRLQDSEKEQQAKREAASQQPARPTERAEAVNENTLSPELREHRRQMRAALAEAEARKQAESQPVNRDAEWKARAESAVSSIQSNLDRAEAEKFLAKAGGWGWELTYKSIINFIERRKQQRSMAGMAGR